MYSDLNLIWESWLGVLTNQSSEAITNEQQSKGLPEYHSLMVECFKEAFRILKPGRWMTVEFSNTQASGVEFDSDSSPGRRICRRECIFIRQADGQL